MAFAISNMWLTSVLTASIPPWFFLFAIILGTFTAFELYRFRKITSDLRKQNGDLDTQRKNAERLKSALEARNKTLEADNEDLQAQKLRLERQVEELAESGPRLHGIWSNSQTFWHICRKGTEPVMQIGGRIHLSSSNIDEVLHLLAAYIEGQRLDLSMTVSVRPDLIEDELLVMYVSPPLESDSRRPFTATITLEDHQNRLHMLPRHTFQPTEQTPPWATPDQW